jgi:nitrogenase molybdenum-iron protein alpha/beta subunit
LDDLTLDDLIIRASSHTPFFGIYLASHAILDAMCMCHASVGCKVKTQEHLVRHDGVQDAHNRRRYSQLIDEDLIQGSTAQLEDEIAAFARRLHSQVVVIDCSTPLSLQVQPLQAVVERSRARTGVDVVHVQARNYQDDLWGGYAATAATLFLRQFEKADAQGPRPKPKADEVSVLGLPFDRYEGDSTGNVAEVRRLLWGLGLKAKAVFFAGEPYATLGEAVHAGHHLALPWLKPALPSLRKLGVTLAETSGLPMGFAGTRQWLIQVAQLTGVDPRRAQAFADGELQAAKPLAELARRSLQGRRFAAFAEAPRLAGLVALLQELGMVPAVLGVSHFRLGGRREVEALLSGPLQQSLPQEVVWLEDPTPHAVAELAHAGPLDPQLDPRKQRPLAGADIVLCSSVEAVPLQAWQGPLVEFGFPSENRHFLLPAPWLGFRGALRLAEQVMQALANGQNR